MKKLFAPVFKPGQESNGRIIWLVQPQRS